MVTVTGSNRSNPKARVTPGRWVKTRLRGPIVCFIDVKDEDTARTHPANMPGNSIRCHPRQRPRCRWNSVIRSVCRSPRRSIPSQRPWADVPILKKIGGSIACHPNTETRRFTRTKPQGTAKNTPSISLPLRCFTVTGLRGDRRGTKSQQQELPGNLVCIDPAKTATWPSSGKVWNYDNMNATIMTVAIVNGLVFP